LGQFIPLYEPFAENGLRLPAHEVQ
jgi:hypothetical protein